MQAHRKLSPKGIQRLTDAESETVGVAVSDGNGKKPLLRERLNHMSIFQKFRSWMNNAKSDRLRDALDSCDGILEKLK
jgi:hypothetical protein